MSPRFLTTLPAATRSVRAKHRDRGERGTASPTFHPGAAAAAASAPLVAGGPGPSASRIETEAAAGYNSGDEYGADCWDLTDDQWQEVSSPGRYTSCGNGWISVCCSLNCVSSGKLRIWA